MKKLCFTAALMLLISCSSDDDTNETITENPSINLSGRWELISKSQNGRLQAITDCEKNYNWYKFGTDNGAIIGKFLMYQSGGNNYCRQNTGQVTYSISDNILTYKSETSNSVTKYNIISANSLTIRLEKFYTKTSTGESTVPQVERIIETCNKVQ